MHQIFVPISLEQADRLEGFFCEAYQEHWMLYENEKLKTHELRGYFASSEEAATEFASLRAEFPDLPEGFEGKELEDKDWKEAYKLHFKPWSDRGLHFVPVWERETYALPAGDEIIYLDPGMAFGTGNHETTRLCLRRVLDAREAWGDSVKERNVIDAGCGSGILAIAAVKVGFTPVFGFDNDPDSVEISVENAALCEVPGQVEFLWQGLEEGLANRTADLVLANILAPILMQYAELLVNAVKPGGRLALSGILAREIDEVQAHFNPVAEKVWGGYTLSEQRLDGEWADLLLERPE
jgi:ribosomal protein L11 methyltransferase